MKLGYIHNNRNEQTRVLRVLKLTSESVAIDELGIGRIRDAFADMMFPGISTLQKHIKYFSLMPQVYKKATERRYNRLSEVKDEIVRLEKILTRNLCDCSADRRGITGSDMIGRNPASYVKYDPAYIYNSGLQTFGILRSPHVHDLIYSASKALHESPAVFRSDDEDTADDDPQKSGLFQFCSFPSVEYDFTVACSLDLTPADCDFITGHILAAPACRGSLLRFLIENPGFILPGKFEDMPSHRLPAPMDHVQDMARRFADFIFMVHVRYNYIFSGYDDDEMRQQFNALLEKYRASATDISQVLSAVTTRESSCRHFCMKVSECLARDAVADGGDLDQCIILRERAVKQARRKIGNPAYCYDRKNRIHYHKLNFRWDTVKLFIEELRKGAANG